eukprot:s990_g15.t1
MGWNITSAISCMLSTIPASHTSFQSCVQRSRGDSVALENGFECNQCHSPDWTETWRARPINRKYGPEADEEIDHLREQVRALTDANLALRREAKEVQPNVVSFGACISALREDPGIQVLKRMQSLRYHEDAFTYSAAMSACVWWAVLGISCNLSVAEDACTQEEKAGKWEEALFLIAAMYLHRLEVDTVCAAAALSACEPPGSFVGSRLRLLVESWKSREWRAALQLLASAEDREAARQRSFIVGCTRMVEGQIGAAADLDSIACNAAISACEKSVEWRCENSSHWRCALGLGPGTQEGLGALMAACEKAYEWRRALSVLTLRDFKGDDGNAAAGDNDSYDYVDDVDDARHAGDDN